MSDPSRFPDDFLWGAATSAYQIEGSPLADGAGPGIWHRFSHTPGRVRSGDTGDVACDHYRRYEEDVALIADLGLGAYRFGLGWGRILPEGTGRLNPAGVSFYSRLIDRLLEHGIAPCITLFHWDLPAALEDRGGWLNPDSVRWFEEFAGVAFAAFGDRVPMWATLNEPWVVVDAGYVHGVNAPGRRSLEEAATAARHLLLAHGAAVRRHRADGRGTLGLVVNLVPHDPASDRPEDRAAAERCDRYYNHQYLDPALLGRNAEGLGEVYGDAYRELSAPELESIREPIDFVGVNYYTRFVVRHDPASWPLRASHVRLPHRTYMETGWEVYPEGLARTLRRVRERYGAVPLYVTENGAAFHDPPKPIAGKVDDPLRVQYYREHLRAARASIREGIDLRGYFAWSLLDNFEWSSGYSLRFGLIHVDYETQRRTLKTSAHDYRDIVRSHGAALDLPPRSHAAATSRRDGLANRPG